MPLYCIVDCAAAPGLHGELMRAGRCCALLAGKLDPDLAEASPHLAQIEQNAPLLNLLVSPEGRAGGFGCVLHADMTLGTLWRTLRKKLIARMPDGEVVMFRFFDPRVLPPYLDSLPPEECAPWFDGITDWWLPRPEATLHYTVSGGTLIRTLLVA
jgi:hypothetical protein